MKNKLFFATMLSCVLSAICAAAYAAAPSVPSDMMSGTRPAGSRVLLDCALNQNLGDGAMSYDKAFTAFGYDSASQSYKLSRVSGHNSYFFSPTEAVFDVKPNRSYLVSALVYCNFDRNNSEVNVGIRVGAGTSDVSDDDPKGEKPITLIDGFHGLPSNTNGAWLRFETEVTTPADGAKARFYGAWYGFADESEEFYIADMEVVELPEKSLTALSPGEGMTFGGSSGAFDMKTDAPKVTTEAITVNTNGAQYVFNKTNDTITVKQRIGKERTLATVKSSKSLSALSVYGTPTDKEAILSTGDGGVTFGIQMDGLVLASTHSSDLVLTVTSAFDGEWNRLLNGHLISKDTDGGFTVNPYIPLGTGRTARVSVLDDIDFARAAGDTKYINRTPKGWRIEWTISSGELVGITAFPPREYDWDASFNSNAANIDFTRETSVWQQYKQSFNLKYGVITGAFRGAWGMSYGNTLDLRNDEQFTAHVTAAKEVGAQPLEYTSMYFWNGTLDEYISEVQRHKTAYGITGVYTDGVPPTDWLKAYEGMRRLREIFPDGCIIMHTTGQVANGGAPLATPEVYIPAIDAYATFTLRGEDVVGDEADWAYPRYVTNGYGGANTIGLQKYNAWTTDGTPISEKQQQLLQLLYNGRARYDGSYSAEYLDILSKLKAQYADNAWSDRYFELCYLPYARRLVRAEYDKAVQNGEFSAYPTQTLLDESFAEEGGILTLEKGTEKEFATLPTYGEAELSFGAAGDAWRVDLCSADGETVASVLKTGTALYSLDPCGGYAYICAVDKEAVLDLTLCADLAENKFSVDLGGEEVLSSAALFRRAPSIKGVKLCAITAAGFKSLKLKSKM